MLTPSFCHWKLSRALLGAAGRGFALAALCLFALTSLRAAEEAQFAVDIPAGEAVSAFNEFSRQTGVQLLYNQDAVAAAKTSAVRGRMTPSAALRQMLDGTGLTARRDEASGAFSVVARPKESADSPADPAPRAATNRDGEEVVTLSPFVVSEQGDSGYISTQTTIGRSANTLMSTPASIVVINRQLIDDMNPTHVGQLLEFGVSGVTQNLLAAEDLTIRGFRSTNQLRNGVSLRSFGRNQLYDVERVEVLKGPGAMVLGNISVLGGGINFITRKPTKERKGFVNVTVGNKDTARVDTTVSGPLYQKGDFSVQYRATAAISTADRDKDVEYDRQKFIGGGLRFEFNPKVSLLIEASYYRTDGYIYFNDFLDMTALPVAKLNTRYLDTSPAKRGDAFRDDDVKMLSGEMLIKLEEHSNLRLFYTYYNYQNPQRLIYGQTLLTDNYTLQRNAIAYTEPFEAVAHTVQADFIHAVNFGSIDNKFMAGVDGNREDLFIKNYLYWPNSPALNPQNLVLPSIDLRNPDFSQDAAIFAIPTTSRSQDFRFETHNLTHYIQDNLEFFNKRLLLTAGTRWIAPGGHTYDNVARTIASVERPTTRSNRYGVVVTPLPWISAYYTKADQLILRSGFLQNNNPNAPRIPIRNSDFKLDEYGLKVDYQPSQNLRLYGSMAIFDMAMTNVPTSAIDPQGYSIQIQEKENTSKGWEADIGFRFKTPSGLADMIVTYYDVETRQASNGLPAAESPSKVYSLLGKYEWTSGPLKGFMIGAGLRDQDEKLTAGYRVDWPVTYTAFARYNWNRRVSTQLNIENLTDERYIVQIQTPALVSASERRSILLSTKYSW